MATMHRISATKSELIRIRADLSLSTEGLSLLERKRDSLMAEGIKLLKDDKALRLDLTKEWKAVEKHWDEALTTDHPDRLQQLAGAVAPLQALRGKNTNWMSVKLSDFQCEEPRLNLLGAVSDCSIRPEKARNRLVKLLPQLAQLMCIETNLRRIAQALKQCQRQVNALEHLLIPELQSEKKRIEQSLEEKDREAIFQTKRLKARKYASVRT
jgi:V/A-type H+-transporting ATPase subunit D